MPTEPTAWLQALAVVCCGTFAGAAAYINFVEHPARMEAGVGPALAQWAPSYRRATLMQAPLALLGGGAALGAWFLVGGRGWLASGLLLVSVVPFTLLVIMPTNRALQAVSAEDHAKVAALLQRWNRLHAVRTALSIASFPDPGSHCRVASFSPQRSLTLPCGSCRALSPTERAV
ncbi:MAG: DUF1772 domain-containing protein [Gemmatimonadaceae bacterium]